MSSFAALAQDLEPRAYSPAPIGTNFVVVGYGHIDGGIIFDPTVPITDVSASINGVNLGLGRAINLFGRQSQIAGVVAYTWGDLSGNVAEQRQSITRSGVADLRFRFSFNLHGSPALTPREFRKRKDSLIVGVSVAVQAPTGQYDPTKLINIGTNRWAFKPEIGFSYPVKKWDFDIYLASWLFTANDQFFPGTAHRTQEPLPTIQGHVSYTFRPRLWAAIDGTWYSGGTVHLNDGPGSGRQNNSRVGATLSVPVRKRQSLKFAYARGAVVRVGSDFTTISCAWQYVWF